MPEELNPYASHKTTLDRTPPDTDAARRRARFHVRASLLLLLIPGVFNYFCFDAAVMHVHLADGTSYPRPLAGLFRTVNIGAITLLALFVWCLGLGAFELATKLLHRVFSRGAELSAWNAVLYQTLAQAGYFAAAGAVLWLIWIVAYYILGVGFFTISCPVGILAHLLAAGLYLQLFYRWYRIERTVLAG